MINPSVLFRLEILSIFVFVALSITGCDNTNADNIDIGALGDIKIPTIGSYEHCPSVSTGKGGKGGEEAYDGFAPFDSTGVNVSNTNSWRFIRGANFERFNEFGIASKFPKALPFTYQKCNVKPGMHASIEFERDKNIITLTLYGNGDFIPDARQYKEVFGDEIGDFKLVDRYYEQDVKAKLDEYKMITDAQWGNSSCHPVGYKCSTKNKLDRAWFEFGTGTVYWRVYEAE
ncbi:hypothetical protein FACS1894185_3660 [Betaproteobacteria bacterium]|nr:hypothetical protein FACS1894185_3660 [Betaproteobacteria bacterium]GHU15061.1 hypothetical protein FACS189441_6170 [Betaproteobacteria bacterium]